jgi:hypothetical protein
MLGRYLGPVILRDELIVPRNYLHKRYPQRRNRYGKLVSDYKVTIEEEIAEIRARHASRREYNRSVRAAKRARQLQGLNNDAADHSALDESNA